ncbi:TetR/AcrR family transcriptional regulator [Luteimonas aestuarii]|uniref:TetR/AcrR family transcriptional regulator n=1 Tax=Luteimonas aestuarii TaxID=453837 RepID=A0A4R5TNF7_9GAMM|nr:TetR family transcriptional regulator [Luteimonas aestuarii]TDK21494.1 TetR/AcrR family transcriptional regulator [Luteimonas aestuarii]
MPSSPQPDVSSRKRPRQARSSGLVDAILEAAVQVLATEGADRFTTTRVAERAGVSVGSLYQYFPNKAAILFRLQSDEWARTSLALRAILEDRHASPLARLRSLVHAFVASECEEAQVREALGDAAPRYRQAPEATTARAAEREAFRHFMVEALPDAAEARRASASALVSTTLAAVGKDFSRRRRSGDEIEAFAAELADMLCGYIERVRRTPDRAGGLDAHSASSHAAP